MLPCSSVSHLWFVDLNATMKMAYQCQKMKEANFLWNFVRGYGLKSYTIVSISNIQKKILEHEKKEIKQLHISTIKLIFFPSNRKHCITIVDEYQNYSCLGRKLTIT